MEGTKRRAANSLGMFDLLKGVGMLTIVFAHTGELYPMGDASHINTCVARSYTPIFDFT